MDNENNFNDQNDSNNQNLITPKSNKNKKIILIAVVIFIVLAGVSGGAYAIINSNPKVKVFNALKATSNELKDKQTVTEKIVGKDYLKNLEKSGINQNMNFNLKSTTIPEAEEYNGAGISLDCSYDQNNKKLMFNMGGQYKGTNIANFEFYTDNSKVMMAVPKLYDSWFTLDADNIHEQYRNSYFAQMGDVKDQPDSIKFFGDEDTKMITMEELVDEIEKGYLKANVDKLATIGKNIKVEKSKQTKNIEIGGVSQDCTGYEVIISGQDAKNFIESVSDYMLEDESVKKNIIYLADKLYNQEGLTYSSSKEMVDDIYKQMKDSNDKFKKSFTLDDINATVYIDKKGRTVSIESNTSINVDDKKIDVKYSSDFKGKDNIGDIIKISTELSNNNGKLKMDLDTKTTTKDDIINDETNLVLAMDNTPVNMDIKSQYNTKNGDFDASADFSADGEGLTASWNGSSTFDKSSKKLALNFDTIDFKSTIDSTPINISLDGSYAIAPIENPIEEPTGEKLELFKLSENKIMEIAQEIENNTMKIVDELK